MIFVLLWAVAAFLVVASLMPLTRIAHGFVQGFDFPREQFLGVALILAGLFYWLDTTRTSPLGAVLMLTVAVVQAGYIGKFTPFWSRQSVAADKALLARKERHIRLLAANVKMSNRDYDRAIALVRQHDPQVVMAIETDQDWIEALKEGLGQTYQNIVEVPQENGYGMCLMSSLPLSGTKVRELITKNVPSIRTAVTLEDGSMARLYMVHPEPPVINHDTVGRDSEIALVGLEAKDDPLPAIVSGDLNDVAWSTTTRRFQRLSRLLDPRVGRGFYNTFSATMPWMRWPLDHLFHDARFRLVEMKRLEKIGSDHFPMWFVLALADSDAINNDPGRAEADEVVEVKAEIRQEQRRDRDPIGEDWEDKN